jgi:hypothetical protein
MPNNIRDANDVIIIRTSAFSARTVRIQYDFGAGQSASARRSLSSSQNQSWQKAKINRADNGTDQPVAAVDLPLLKRPATATRLHRLVLSYLNSISVYGVPPIEK